MNLNKAADLVEEQGRFGDTELVHLNPLEVKMLEKMVPGGKLTRNPVTGKREAFIGILSAIVSIVTTGASIAASRKNRKKSEEAAQEAAYVEGAAPVIPNANQLAIETIGDAPSPEAVAPDFREALAGSYGGDMYETQDFQSEQIPPEILEALLMQQQGTGMEPSNVQFANSGGPVGLPQDVYQFPVEKISQMQMDVDPGVRNVGNAMMAQMEGNPGMGMVSASAADIDQMAAGGPVRPKKYQDGDQVKGTDQSLSELKQRAKSRGISRIEELLGFRLPEGLGEQDIEDVLLNAGLGELGIPITKRGDNYSYARELGEDSNINVSVNPDQKAVQLGFEKRFNTGGPVQPRRYADGSEGGLDIFAMLDQTAGAEGRPTGREMEREYLREMMNAPSEDPLSVENIKKLSQEQKRIKEAEEASSLFLSEEGPLRPPVVYSEEDTQRLMDAGPYGPSALEQLLNKLGTTAQKKGFGIERRFDEGPLEMFLKARRDRKTSVPPIFGPQMSE